ncbi:hypothetical protein GF325_09700 [Candidatus Bathyarchaeota archaeon]|nr:hypothetical protein [Candidatus Bathyarchaeota archaeon]
MENPYFREDLSSELLKDGSLVNRWLLVDQGHGLVSLPMTLEQNISDVNGALLDLMIRLVVVHNEKIDLSWGPCAHENLGEPDMYSDYEAVNSHVFLEYLALVNESAHVANVEDTLDLYTQELESIWSGLAFHQFDYSDTNAGGGRRYLSIQLRAFPSTSILKDALGDLLDSHLPNDAGIFRIDKSDFLGDFKKSIQIVANWDGLDDDPANDQYYDYDQTEQDERWEFSASIFHHDKKKINIKSDSTNTLKFSKIMPFSGSLPSNPVANVSRFSIRLYHGTEIIGATPNLVTMTRSRSMYSMDMLGTGEGASYQLPESANLNFTDGDTGVPVLKIDVDVDSHMKTSGENVTFSYNVTNIGDSTAYDVELEDGFSQFIIMIWLDGLPGGFSIVEGDSDSDGDVNMTWSEILPGESKYHEGIVNGVPTLFYRIASNPIARYHAASNYDDTNTWARNPDDPSGGYTVTGEHRKVSYTTGVTLLEVSLDINNDDPSHAIGDTMTATLEISNHGDVNATDLSWRAPELGINLTDASGSINLLEPNETVVVSTQFLLDLRFRYQGAFVDTTGFDPTASITESFLTVHPSQECPLNVFPKTNVKQGPILQVWHDLVEVQINGQDCVQVTVHCKNVGDSTAHDLIINTMLPDPATVISGNNINTWIVLPEGTTISPSFIVTLPEGGSLEVDFFYTIVDYDMAPTSSFLDPYMVAGEKTFAAAIPSSIPWDMIINILIGILVIVSAAAVVFGIAILREKKLFKKRRAQRS